MTETHDPVPGATHSVPDARGYKWKNIGTRISDARTKAGFTQRRLSELLGVSSQTVWCWEAGRMKPTHERLLELAYQCQVTTDWLLGRDVVEAEVLKETEASFRDAIAGLPLEDLESIQEFIRFVRERRRRSRRTKTGV